MKLIFKLFLYPIEIIETFIAIEVVKWIMGYKIMVILELAMLAEFIRWAFNP